MTQIKNKGENPDVDAVPWQLSLFVFLSKIALRLKLAPNETKPDLDL